MTKPLDPLIRYPGSKSSIAGWIQQHAPHCVNKNIPFAGSLGYFLNSPRAKMESVNDLNGDLINLLITLRDQRQALIAAIEATYFSPRELMIAQQPTSDNLEAARRFYTLCWLSFKPYENGRELSFRRQYRQTGGMTSAAKLFARSAHLNHISARLRGVTIEEMNALKYIQKYDHDGAFFYVDPPYPFSTRGRKTPIYHIDKMSDDDHRQLAGVLNGLKGKAIISGYVCPLYEELYEAEGWARIDKNARINGGASKAESIWISPNAQERRLI